MFNAYKWRLDQGVYIYISKQNGKYITGAITADEEDALSKEVSSWNETNYSAKFNQMIFWSSVGTKYPNIKFSTYDKYFHIDSSRINVVYGEKGDKGDQGPQGEKGDQGQQGDKGDKGDRGPKGDDAVLITSTALTYNARAFIYSAETPSKPVQESGSYDFVNSEFTPPSEPDQWYKNSDPDVIPYTEGYLCFYTTKTFYNDGTVEEWSNPHRITGVKGEDSETEEYVYTRTTNLSVEPTLPPNIEMEDWSQNVKVDGSVLSSDGDYTWYDQKKQSVITITYRVQWSAMRSVYFYKYYDEKEIIHYTIENGDDGDTYEYTKLETPVYGNWEGPFAESKWGEDGTDGDGMEQIFTLTVTNTEEINPPTGSGSGNTKKIEDDEWYGLDTNGRVWTDRSYGDITEDTVCYDGDINAGKRAYYEWVSTRTSKTEYSEELGTLVKTKVWGDFGEPQQWSRYLSDGESGESFKSLGTYENFDDLSGHTVQKGDGKYFLYSPGSPSTTIAKDPLENGDVAITETNEAYFWTYTSTGGKWTGPFTLSTSTAMYSHTKYAKNIYTLSENDPETFEWTDSYEDEILSSTTSTSVWVMYGFESHKTDLSDKSVGYYVEWTYEKYNSEDEDKYLLGKYNCKLVKASESVFNGYIVYGIGEGTEGAKYYGMYFDNMTTDSNYPQDYTWYPYGGEDGTTIENIYILTQEYEGKPVIPVYTDSSGNKICYYKSGENKLSCTLDSETYQTADFIPCDEDGNVWYDDSVSVDEENKYRWRCTRKKMEGMWQPFKGDANGYALLDKNYTIATEGATGSDAPVLYPEGKYNASTLYTRTTTSTPYVYIYSGDTKEYFFLKGDKGKYSGVYDNGSLSGGTEDKTWPQTYFNYDESTLGTADSPWEKMENFEALWAQYAIIDGGTFGSMVFNGNYIFSEYGTDENGSMSFDRKYFWKLSPYFDSTFSTFNMSEDDNQSDSTSLAGYAVEMIECGWESTTEITIDVFKKMYENFSGSTDNTTTCYYHIYKFLYDDTAVKDMASFPPVDANNNEHYFYPNWCVDLRLGYMWTNNGLVKFRDNSFTLSNENGEKVMYVDSYGNLNIAGGVFSLYSKIDDVYSYRSCFIPCPQITGADKSNIIYGNNTGFTKPIPKCVKYFPDFAKNNYTALTNCYYVDYDKYKENAGYPLGASSAETEALTYGISPCTNSSGNSYYFGMESPRIYVSYDVKCLNIDLNISYISTLFLNYSGGTEQIIMDASAYIYIYIPSFSIEITQSSDTITSTTYGDVTYYWGTRVRDINTGTTDTSIIETGTYLKTPTFMGGNLHYITVEEMFGMVGKTLQITNSLTGTNSAITIVVILDTMSADPSYVEIYNGETVTLGCVYANLSTNDGSPLKSVEYTSINGVSVTGVDKCKYGYYLDTNIGTDWNDPINHKNAYYTGNVYKKLYWKVIDEKRSYKQADMTFSVNDYVI